MSYGSASDLPSYQEARASLKLLRFASVLLPKEQRAQVRALPQQLERLVRVVDDFYALLGPAHWVFHDDLRVEDMLALERSHAGDPEPAEAALIAWYQTGDHLEFMVQRLNSVPAWRARMPLIQRALEDYRAGRYYAVVQVLISVMDGFVNDMDPANRKGLHAYRSEDIDPWDSVVGHHMGLAATQETFTKPFKARDDQPVVELYRNGIVHGMLTNYDNVVVATKAWNRLFAVSDWGKSLRELSKKASEPPAPRLRDSLRSYAANQKRQVVLDAFIPAQLTTGDPQLLEHDAYKATDRFLQIWNRRRWGLMPALIAPQLGAPVTVKQVKSDYVGEELSDYCIDRLVEQSPAITHVYVTLTINEQTFHPVFRWIYEDEQGGIKVPGLDVGTWKLIQWGTPYMKRDVSADEQL